MKSTQSAKSSKSAVVAAEAEVSTKLSREERRAARAAWATEDSEEKAKRPAFPLESAVDADGRSVGKDLQGRLEGIPVNWENTFQPLKKSDFATTELFFDWKIDVVRRRADAQIAELEAMKNETATGPNPTEKAKRKVVKMAKQLAALKAALAESGIDVSELGL
jgi:hypothetical protein